MGGGEWLVYSVQSLIIGLTTNNCAAERGVVFRVLNGMGCLHLWHPKICAKKFCSMIFVSRNYPDYACKRKQVRVIKINKVSSLTQGSKIRMQRKLVLQLKIQASCS